MYNINVSIDKELYRWAFEQYRQWNEAAQIARLRNAGKSQPGSAWEQYVDLFEFNQRVGFQRSVRQRAQKLADLDHYYIKIQKFEAWKRARGG